MPAACVTIASSTRAHLERVAMLLVVEDVASGERRLREVVDQRLLAQRQRGELIRIQLHHRRIVHALEQVFALGGRGGEPGVAGAADSGLSAREHAAAMSTSAENDIEADLQVRLPRSVAYAFR